MSTRVRLAALAATVLTTAASLPTREANAFCSVFDDRPCAPAFCSVFEEGPCFPEVDSPIGQDLRLTIETPATAVVAPDTPAGELNTLRDVFAALRNCWQPPDADRARRGMTMSIRLAFKRNGEIISAPRVTFVSRDAPQEARAVYRNAIDASLERCSPLPFSQKLAGALAGRPLSVRFIDNRKLRDN